MVDVQNVLLTEVQPRTLVMSQLGGAAPAPLQAQVLAVLGKLLLGFLGLPAVLAGLWALARA